MKSTHIVPATTIKLIIVLATHRCVWTMFDDEDAVLPVLCLSSRWRTDGGREIKDKKASMSQHAEVSQ